METRNIRDFIHLYLGCECEVEWKPYMPSHEKYRKIDGWLIHVSEGTESIKPILRPLSDMTEEERMWFFNSLCRKHEGLDYSEWITEYNGNPVEPHWVLWVKDQRIKHGYTIGINNHFQSEEFRWLLSKGFDLFGLIEAGLAIDKTKLSKQ